MATAVMKSSPVDEICAHLISGEPVVVDGGAGSGKTHALVETISALRRERPKSHIACITYTNAAAGEVRERAAVKALRVSTIHDFLWDCMKQFQVELAGALKNAIEDEGQPLFRRLVDAGGNEIPLSFSSVSYRDYTRLADGVVSHDQVLVLARAMFAEHAKLRRLTADRYPYILVDEYQDTSPVAMDVLLQLLKLGKPHRCSVAFFGDPMQSIYDGSIGNLEDHVNSGLLHRVRIEQNRRNPEEVIALANKLRTDGLRQSSSSDAAAPNMADGKLRRGKVLLVEGDDPHGEQAIAASGILGNSPGDNVKILRLTHRLIAADGGFPSIDALYGGSDPILKLASEIRKKLDPDDLPSSEGLAFSELAKAHPCSRRNKPSLLDEILSDEALKAEYEKASDSTLRELSSHYLKRDNLYAQADQRGIAPDWCPVTVAARKALQMVGLYEARDFSGLLESHRSLPIASNADKAKLAETLEGISGMRDHSVGEAIDLAFNLGLLVADDAYVQFGADHAYLFGRMRSIKLAEFERFFAYYDDAASLITQHKVKGLEYDYVIVTLNNGGWSKYNFNRRLVPPSESAADDSVAARTRKLLYVACTRAKKGLALYTCGTKLDEATVDYLFRHDQVIPLSDVIVEANS